MTEEIEEVVDVEKCPVCGKLYNVKWIKRHMKEKHPEPEDIIDIPELIPEPIIEPPKKKKKKKKDTPPPPPPKEPESLIPLTPIQLKRKRNQEARIIKDKLIAEEGH